MINDDDGGVDVDDQNDGDEKYAEQSHGLAPKIGASS
jgi:hypothetical protein